MSVENIYRFNKTAAINLDDRTIYIKYEDLSFVIESLQAIEKDIYNTKYHESTLPKYVIGDTRNETR